MAAEIAAEDEVLDDEVLIAAIRDHPYQAAEALVTVQADAATWPTPAGPMTLDSLRASAAAWGEDLEEFWVERLRKQQLVAPFVAALRARGVPLAAVVTTDGFADHVDPQRLGTFASQAQSFRCRVLVNDRVVGSGCLVGPSLVLTAWHVIAIQPPGQPQEPVPRVEVRLADGSRHEVGVPPRFGSPCGDHEYTQRAPRRDDDVTGRHDVALLLMRRPAAIHLGHFPLPRAVGEVGSGSALFLVHFPQGGDQGFGLGKVSKIRNLTARWRHDITTREGSSGGACFDRKFDFAGLHQGKVKGGGRFVPVSRFIDDLRRTVAADLAPPRLWSLDGTAGGPLVIGRALLFEALAAAGDDAGRVRGVRVKRRDVAGESTAALTFTHDILRHLLERRGADHLLVRLPFNELIDDAIADIRERVGAAGLSLPQSPVPPGVSRGAAAPEGAARDRAALLAAMIDAAAAAAGHTVWFFLDNPTVILSEEVRLTLDGFVAAALVQPRLRLVITGFETVPLPGQEFQAPSEAAVAGPPGLVVEYIGGFTRDDVLALLTLARQDLTGHPPDHPVSEAAADRVLHGLPSFNGVFDDAALPAVAAGLRADLAVIAERGDR